ncbi:hypothetical protein M9H77_06915 [Catharanthus roseus]|uniref:Uncharacterized protein n=1 Tax=Catharanthus roseus TaxID=4058 RepID=A0ACC0BTF0_CATRO|nr:hypothetical protein M9H77_06915 [Catharanthus roseus]
MTDLQIRIRFIEKIRTISAVQKWSIRIEREFRVVKKESNSWSLEYNQSHQRTHMPCSDYSKQALKYDFKVYFKTNIASCCQRSRDPCLKRYPRSPSIAPDGLYIQEGMVRLELHCITRAGIYMVKSPILLDGSGNDVYTLKMNEKLCSCGKCQEYTLPCSHTLKVCKYNGTRPDAYALDICL